MVDDGPFNYYHNVTVLSHVWPFFNYFVLKFQVKLMDTQ